MVFDYGKYLINSVNKNDGKITDEFIEDINYRDGDTEKEIAQFQGYIDQGFQDLKQKLKPGQKIDLMD